LNCRIDFGVERQRETIEWLAQQVLEKVTRGEALDPCALFLLLRCYCATGRADFGDALGIALARALDDSASRTRSNDTPQWLMLFAEACAVSDDERLVTAALDLVRMLRDGWGGDNVEALMWSVDACLAAGDVCEPRELVPAAIDELERLAGAAYRPGGGIARLVAEPDGQRGRLADQVRAASALLAGYSRTARLPYAMLAEELMQFARRTLWDDRAGGFFDLGTGSPDGVKSLAFNCEAARVLCRLAALHDDADYRGAAVLAPDAEYARDADRTLAALEPRCREGGIDVAIFGVALGERLALRSAE